MNTNEILILTGGGLHFLTLIASAMVPKTLNLKGELGKLIPFLRTLFWVYGAFIVLAIIAFGVIAWSTTKPWQRAKASRHVPSARSLQSFGEPA